MKPEIYSGVLVLGGASSNRPYVRASSFPFLFESAKQEICASNRSFLWLHALTFRFEDTLARPSS